jgi:NADH-quinone oxidoreductase subunit L
LTGFFFTAGYYSKDAILEAAFANGRRASTAGFFVGASSWRAVDQLLFVAAGVPHLLWRAALGRARSISSMPCMMIMGIMTRPMGMTHHGHHAPATGTAGYHPHESPLSMLIPLFVLGAGALFAGWVWHE